MDKSPEAFRTISEVAEDLDLPQHVLRFWETRFNQIKPMKRGGGRRYYRPDDVDLLRGIRHLLYGHGFTIRGVQKILREQGVRHVMTIWRDDIVATDIVAGDVEQGLSFDDAADDMADARGEPRLPFEGARAVPSAPMAEHRVEHHTDFVETLHAAPRPVASQYTAPEHQSAPEHRPSAEMHPHGEPSVAPVASAHPVTPRVAPPVHPARDAEYGEAHAGRGEGHGAGAPAEPRFAPVRPAAPAVQGQAPAHRPTQSRPAESRSPEVHAPVSPRVPADIAEHKAEGREYQPARHAVARSVGEVVAENAPRMGFMDRLRGHDRAGDHHGGLNREDVRRLQATLFELLECKRLLDQAR